MAIKDLQNKIIRNGGYILSDGTLNLQHLLPKAYDILINYELDDNFELQNEILSCFELRIWSNQEFINKGFSLFVEQYHNDAKLKDDKQIEASDIWEEDINELFNNIAPDGFYFGSTEGDGACIGWFKYESEEDNEEESDDEHEQLTLEQLSNHKEWSEAVIVFKQESFGVKRRQFTLTECSYKVKSTAKYFDPSMIGNSLIGDCLDEKDLGVRLDIYMNRSPSEGARWEVDYCYIIQ